MTAAAAILVLTLVAGAQAPESAASVRGLPVGSRLRIESSTAVRPLVGTLLDVRDDALVLGSGRSQASRVTFSAISKLEVSTGRKSQAGRGAMVGAAVGALPGLLLTWGDDPESETSPAVVAAVGAASGALVGAAIGWAIKTDRWQQVDLPHVGVAFVPLRRGAAFALRLAWGRGVAGIPARH